MGNRITPLLKAWRYALFLKFLHFNQITQHVRILTPFTYFAYIDNMRNFKGLIRLVQQQSLFELISNAQNNDESSKLLVLERFSNTIKCYSRKLNYYCAETDLIIFILVLVQNLNLKKLKSLEEGVIVKYIYISIKREYIRLSKKNSYINSHEIVLDANIIDYFLFIKYIADNLTGNQKKVFLYFIDGYSNTEIANLIGISKQAVGKIKKKIILKLRKEYENTI